MSNAYEQAGRLRKTAALVALLQAHRIPATRVEAMTCEEWVALAAKAKVKLPSVDTQAAVLAELRKAEALAKRAERDFRKAFTPNRHGEYA